MYDNGGGIQCSAAYQTFGISYGGTYLRDPDKPHLDALVDFAERRLQEIHAASLASSGTLPRFEGHILASPHMNAAVGKTADFYSYGLFAGMVEDYYASSRRVGRAEDADLLFELATDFTVAHEIKHVVHGHLGLGVAEFGNGARDELGNVGFSLLDDRTMEMDADCAAVASIFLNVSGGGLAFEEGVDAPVLRFAAIAPRSLQAAVELVGATLAMCFDQMERGEESLHREPDERTHPVTITRLAYCQAQLASLLSLAPALAEAERLEATAVLLDATKVALDALGNTSCLAGGAPEREAFTQAQLATLQRNWVELQPRLSPHAFVKLAPARPYDPVPPSPTL